MFTCSILKRSSSLVIYQPEQLLSQKINLVHLVDKLESVTQNCQLKSLFLNFGVLLLKACGLGELSYEFVNRCAHYDRLEYAKVLDQYFGREIRDRDIPMLDRGRKWATFRDNFNAFMAQLIHKTMLCFQCMDYLIELLSALAESKARNVRQSAIKVLEQLVSILCEIIRQTGEHSDNKRKRSTTEFLEKMMELLKSRQKDVDSGIRSRASRCVLMIIEALGGQMVDKQTLRLFIDQGKITYHSVKSVRQLLQHFENETAGLKIMEFLHDCFDVLVDQAAPKMTRRRDGLGWEPRMTNKSTTVAILGLLKLCVTISKKNSKKFKKNKDFTHLFSRISITEDQEVNTLLLHLIVTRKAYQHSEPLLHTKERVLDCKPSLYKIIRFLSKSHQQTEGKAINYNSSLYKIFAQVFARCMNFEEALEIILTQRIGRQKLNHFQQGVLSVIFYHIATMQALDEEEKLYRCLMSHLKQIFHNRMSERDKLPQTVVTLLSGINSKFFHQQESGRLLALLQLLQTILYCKKERFLIEKAVGLLTLFAKNQIPAALDCVRRVLNSLKLQSVLQKHQPQISISLIILSYFSNGLILEHYGYDLSLTLQDISRLSVSNRLSMAKVIFNEHNNKFKKLLKNSSQFESYKLTRAQLEELILYLLRIKEEDTDSRVFIFRMACEFISITSHDKLILFKFLYKDPHPDFIAFLIPELQQVLVDADQSVEEPLASLSLGLSKDELAETELSCMQKLVRSCSELNRHQQLMQIIVKLMNSKSTEKRDQGLALLTCNVDKEILPEFQKNMPFWKVIYQLGQYICIKLEKPSLCKEMVKKVLKAVFYQKKQEEMSKHSSKLVLFIADSIEQCLQRDHMRLFYFLGQLVKQARNRIGSQVLKRLAIFAQGKKSEYVGQREFQKLDRFIVLLRENGRQEVASRHSSPQRSQSQADHPLESTREEPRGEEFHDQQGSSDRKSLRKRSLRQRQQSRRRKSQSSKRQ